MALMSVKQEMKRPLLKRNHHYCSFCDGFVVVADPSANDCVGKCAMCDGTGQIKNL